MNLSSTREVDSRYAWFRLAVSIALSTVGGVGMWSVVVALPAVQADFGAARGGASLPYTLTMIGFAAGGVLMGRRGGPAGDPGAGDRRRDHARGGLRAVGAIRQSVPVRG